MFYTPLEQFQLSLVYPIYFQFFDLSITNFAVTVIGFLALVWVLSFFIFVYNFKLYNPVLSAYVFLSIYKFVSGVLIQQSGDKGRPYIALAFTIFLVVLGSNFLGLTVVGFTLTAQFSIVAALSFSLNLGLFVLGFYIHGFQFLKYFVPSGIPVFLVPFMTIIEIFSYSIRSVSLSVRLFANMMAGHTLLHIIGSFFVVLFWTHSHAYLSGLSFLLLFAVSVLEIAIAFLQAYIFLILFCIYLNDSLSGGAH